MIFNEGFIVNWFVNIPISGLLLADLSLFISVQISCNAVKGPYFPCTFEPWNQPITRRMNLILLKDMLVCPDRSLFSFFLHSLWMYITYLLLVMFARLFVFAIYTTYKRHLTPTFYLGWHLPMVSSVLYVGM